MTVYNLYIFDRNGTCLYYQEWCRTKQSGMSKEEEFKLMYGMLFSINSFCKRMSPTDQQHGFLNFRTSEYKLHSYETPSGFKFIMTTDLACGSIRDVLHHLYSNIFNEYVVKNPLCKMDEAVKSELFETKLDEYIRSVPVFATKVSS